MSRKGLFLSRSAVYAGVASCLLLASCFLTQPRTERPPERIPFDGMIGIGESREGDVAGGGKAYFTVVVTTASRIGASAEATAGSACDPLLELQDAMGSVMARDDNGGGGVNARLSAWLNPGRYAVVLYNNTQSAGQCRFRVWREEGGPGPDIQPGQNQQRPPKQAGPIALGETKNGALGQGERHAYSFSVQEPTPVTIDLQSDNSPLDPYLVLENAQKQVIAQDDDGGGGTNARIVSQLAPGSYTVIAQPYGNSMGTYRLTLTKGMPAAPATPEVKTVERGALSIGRRIDANLALNERHLYSLKLEKKENIAIDANRLGQAMDPVLELSGPDGKVIAQDDDGGGDRNASIARSLEKGEYRVAVFGYGGSQGPYRLYVSRVHIEPQAHTTIEPGVVREAFLGPTDSHRYAFKVTKKLMAEINLKSADGVIDPFLELQGADGRVLGKDDDGGGNRDSKLYSYLEPGEYVAVAKSYGNTSGRYALSLSLIDIPPQEHTDIAVGIARGGWILPGKMHNYEFISGKKALYSIDAVSDDGRFDPMLTLKDAQGQPMGQDDDGGGGNNARIITELGPGSFGIGVLGYGGSSTGKYRLSVTEMEKQDIRPGETRDGMLEDRGTRVFAFDLREKGLVTIEGKRGDASQFDPYLSLVRAGAGLVARDDDGGGDTNAKISTMLDEGRYFIILTGYGGTGGRYLVSLERRDLPAPVNERIRVGDVRRGTIFFASQRDRYSFTVSGDRTLTITAAQDNSRLDTFVEIFDAQGNMINSDDDGGGGTNSMVRMRFSPGEYSVVVRSYSNSAGAYVLEVREQ